MNYKLMMLIYLAMKDIDYGINATNNKKNLKILIILFLSLMRFKKYLEFNYKKAKNKKVRFQFFK